MKSTIFITFTVVVAFIFGVCFVSTASAKGKPPRGEELPWGVDRIDADKAWGTTKGLGIKVAVIDTGIDENHPDLFGKTDGVNFVGADWPGDQSYGDTSGHGTGIAGIITANDNTIGVVGVAPEVTLYSVKVREKSGTVYPDNYPNHGDTYNFTALCNGMRWCIGGPDGIPGNSDDPGIQVINFSLGIWTVTSDGQREYPLHDHEFYNLIHEAYQNGIVIVAAAGNDSRSIGIYNNPDTSQDVVFSDKRYDFPASYPEVIAVSATAMKTTGKPSERGDIPASWTSYGPAIWVSAPGAAIYTTTINGKYGTGSGTSYAAPHVVGTVALLLATGMPASDVRETLKNTAEKLGDSGWDEYYGWGLVDAEAAVNAAAGTPAAPPRYAVYPTGKLSVTWGRLKGE